MEQVSWNDSQEFIKNLNSKTGKQYRLPREAEWEYACLANSTGKYCGGDKLDDLAWYDKNSDDSTQMVGEKQSNIFGLHDMSGNVWEWCMDWYDEDYHNLTPQYNSTGPSSALNRVIRGGGWLNRPEYLRSVNRFRTTPDYRDSDLGFRLVLPVQ